MITELKLTNNPCKFCNGEIDEGKPEWGAEQGKQYFVITWEDKCSK